MRVGGIDIGTNTVRLLIADIEADPWISEKPIIKRFYEKQRITRLGEGMISTGYLQEAAMARTLAVLRGFKDDLKRHAISDVTCAGTSAIRETGNGRVFIRQVAQKIGFDIEVLSEQEEARRTLLGVENALDVVSEAFLVVDIGGGSTELILKTHQEVPRVISTPLGVVKLVEQHFYSDPPSNTDLKGLVKTIESTLKSAWKSLEPAKELVVVGTAGTATTLAAMQLGLTKYDPDQVQGFRMTLGQIEHWLTRLAGLSYDKRSRIPGLERGREDLIIAGTAILIAILKMAGVCEWVVSDAGLREGLLVNRWKQQFG